MLGCHIPFRQSLALSCQRNQPLVSASYVTRRWQLYTLEHSPCGRRQRKFRHSLYHAGGSCGKAPMLLILRTRWRLPVNFTHWPLYPPPPREKPPHPLWEGRGGVGGRAPSFFSFPPNEGYPSTSPPGPLSPPPPGKEPRNPFDRRLGGPQIWSWGYKEKILLPLPGLKHQAVQPTASRWLDRTAG